MANPYQVASSIPPQLQGYIYYGNFPSRGYPRKDNEANTVGDLMVHVARAIDVPVSSVWVEEYIWPQHPNLGFAVYIHRNYKDRVDLAHLELQASLMDDDLGLAGVIKG